MSKKYSDRRPRGTAPIAAALLACLAAAAMPSCARKAAPKTAASEQERAITSKSAAQGAPGPSIGAAGGPGGGGPASRASAAPAPALAASLRAFGLGARPRPRMPEDFSLGPLQSLRPSSSEEAPLAAARAFLDGLAAGKVDPSVYLPEARAALAALLEPRPAEDGTAASGARLGAIAVEGDAASLRVRLPGKEGSARIEGLLSLREEGGAWYVEALALDPPTSAALAFDPGARPAAR